MVIATCGRAGEFPSFDARHERVDLNAVFLDIPKFPLIENEDGDNQHNGRADDNKRYSQSGIIAPPILYSIMSVCAAMKAAMTASSRRQSIISMR